MSTILVLGALARAPYAGTAWQVLHHLEGFRRLGYDVYYIDDTQQWPYDPEQGKAEVDSHYVVDYLARLMTWCGLGDRWAYRAVADGNRVFGMPSSRFKRLLTEADVLVNMSGATVLREDHLRVPVRIYLETDPVRPQVEVATGNSFTIEFLGAHTHHVTYAENLGAPDCGVPSGTFDYRLTRPPVVLDWWGSDSRRRTRRGSATAGRRFTTVTNWEQSGKDIEWRGELYTWSKHSQFLRLIDLPSRLKRPPELALGRTEPETVRTLRSHGWHVTDALRLSKDILPYRGYILGSDGEFTVAKDQNVRLRSGWFSDRSACYLAAGKPVITEDTGFGNVLPTGEGLFAFTTPDDAVEAFERIDSNYEAHSEAARAIATEYFKAEDVLARLLEETGI